MIILYLNISLDAVSVKRRMSDYLVLGRKAECVLGVGGDERKRKRDIEKEREYKSENKDNIDRMRREQ